MSCLMMLNERYVLITKLQLITSMFILPSVLYHSLPLMYYSFQVYKMY